MDFAHIISQNNQEADIITNLILQIRKQRYSVNSPGSHNWEIVFEVLTWFIGLKFLAKFELQDNARSLIEDAILTTTT